MSEKIKDSDQALLDAEELAFKAMKVTELAYKEARLTFSRQEIKVKDSRTAASDAHEAWARLYHVTKRYRERKVVDSPARTPKTK